MWSFGKKMAISWSQYFERAMSKMETEVMSVDANFEANLQNTMSENYFLKH